LPADDHVLARRYRAYLFDLDGTLVDSAPDINAALNAALGVAGYPPVTETESRSWVGFGSRVLIERALAHLGVPDRCRDASHMRVLLDAFIAYYRDHIADSSRLYPDVATTLATLAGRGAGLAVVTNKYFELSQLLLRAVRLADFFAVVVGGDSLTKRKPDAAPVHHACALLGCVAVEALFVGDSVTDVQTARAAGCAVVCVRGGYSHGAAVESLGADAVIDSIGALI
jgi:phosphoglycolate phosphatase